VQHPLREINNWETCGQAGGRTLACGEVTRVGKLGYFSWMSFRRYSVDCCVPHGILPSTFNTRFPQLKVHEPFCVTEDALPVENGGNRRGSRVE